MTTPMVTPVSSGEIGGTGPAVIARNVTKSYRGVRVLHGVGVTVLHGEVVALLGPNGAGKSTFVEILAGLRRRDGGLVSVLGENPAAPSGKFRSNVGIMLQECGFPPFVKVSELIQLYATYHRAANGRCADPDELLAKVGLVGQAGARVEVLSSGQRRRLDLALVLSGEPSLLFLDEPTTGFDPAGRREAWELIVRLRREGRTIFLSTHLLDEATAIADRVLVIDGGRVLADGQTDDLIEPNRRSGHVVFEVTGPFPDVLPGIPIEREGKRFTLVSTDVVSDLLVLLNWASRHGIVLECLEVKRPTLEDAYLRITAK